MDDSSLEHSSRIMIREAGLYNVPLQLSVAGNVCFKQHGIGVWSTCMDPAKTKTRHELCMGILAKLNRN